MSADIERLRAVGKAATEGPWYFEQALIDMGENLGKWFVHNGADKGASCVVVAEAEAESSATFIATARNEWDALLDRVEAAEAKVARVEALLPVLEDRARDYSGLAAIEEKRGAFARARAQKVGFGAVFDACRDIRAALADEVTP